MLAQLEGRGSSQETICYGAGGHARVVIDVGRACLIHFSRVLVDEQPLVASLGEVPVCSAASIDLASLKPFSFFVAVGRNEVRHRIFEHLKRHGSPITLIHPFSSVSPGATIGDAVVIMPGAVVNTGARIEDDVILNTCSSVDHDCKIGAHSHLCPGVHLAGNVTVGSGTMLGTGTSVIPGIQIGANCIIGAGSVVIRDIPDNCVAFGVPARVVKSNQPNPLFYPT